MYLRRAGWLVLVLVVAGCGTRTGNVSGTVKYQNKPLPGGSITFLSDSKNSVTATIDKDGKYSAPKVGVGQARVTITPLINMGGMTMSTGTPTPQAPPPALPPKFNDPDKSGLTYDVTVGDQTKDFNLE
jgi:hypothetical protein